VNVGVTVDELALNLEVEVAIIVRTWVSGDVGVTVEEAIILFLGDMGISDTIGGSGLASSTVVSVF